MGKIIAVEYISLDGVVEDPGPAGEFRHRGWTMPYWSDELGKAQGDLLFASEALLLGRVTYQEFLAAWPSRSGDPFSDRINSMPKYVASRSLKGPLEWNASLLKGEVPTAVRTLKDKAQGDLLIYGSGDLVTTLTKHKLIDMYRIMLYPVALGSGQRYFKDTGEKASLNLKSATTTSAGVVILDYGPA
ncbi:MAG: dihydrofolate reductase family protein [Gemmatimonadaceae bacterium]